MTNTNETFIIYQKYLDLTYYINNLCMQYPQFEKLALTSETKQSMYIGLRHLMYAFKELNRTNKLQYLNNLGVELNLQKVFVRIAFERQYISKQNYETWHSKFTNICAMLGEWINTCITQ